jgi:hypothetical protein
MAANFVRFAIKPTFFHIAAMVCLADLPPLSGAAKRGHKL